MVHLGKRGVIAYFPDYMINEDNHAKLGYCTETIAEFNTEEPEFLNKHLQESPLSISKQMF